jgi:hypothetical protein
MSRVRVRLVALLTFRVAALALLLMLACETYPFLRAPWSTAAAQEPPPTPGSVAIPPGTCTYDRLNKLVQSVAHPPTGSGQASPELLRALLDSLSTCYTDLKVADRATCDQQAVQRVNLSISAALLTGQPFAEAQVDALLAMVGTCYVDAPAVTRPTGSGGANGGGNGGGGGGGGGGNGGGAGSGGGSTQTDGPGDPYLGPYRAVKVMNMGGESLDGAVCALGQPFTVHLDTPRISFNIHFAPAGAAQGGWTYAYGFPSLGETHNATGSYEISASAPDGTRRLTIDGRDRVVFNGFDGPIPMHYVIGLMPAAEPICGR